MDPSILKPRPHLRIAGSRAQTEARRAATMHGQFGSRDRPFRPILGRLKGIAETNDAPPEPRRELPPAVERKSSEQTAETARATARYRGDNGGWLNECGVAGALPVEYRLQDETIRRRGPGRSPRTGPPGLHQVVPVGKLTAPAPRPRRSGGLASSRVRMPSGSDRSADPTTISEAIRRAEPTLFGF